MAVKQEVEVIYREGVVKNKVREVHRLNLRDTVTVYEGALVIKVYGEKGNIVETYGYPLSAISTFTVVPVEDD